MLKRISIKPKLLIASSAPLDIQVLAQGLKADHTIKIATTAEQVLALANSPESPDLILIEDRLLQPKEYALLTQLKNEPYTRAIPIMLISDTGSDPELETGLQQGLADVVAKPFFLPLVTARIQTHLELKRRLGQIAALTLVDGLTGIANRRRFDELMTTEWNRAVRNRRPLTLLLIEIDDLGDYMREFGLSRGGDCLKAVGRVLQNTLERSADFVARFENTIFAAVLPGTDPTGARTIATAMRQNVAALGMPHTESATTEHITVSIGAATTVPGRKRSLAQLVVAAKKLIVICRQSGPDQARCLDLDRKKAVASGRPPT